MVLLVERAQKKSLGAYHSQDWVTGSYERMDCRLEDYCQKLLQVSYCPKKNVNGARMRGAEQVLATIKWDDDSHRWRAAKDTWMTCW